MDHLLGMRINPDAYTTRPAIIQAAKNNAYYIGRLKQHLDDFDKDLAEWKSSGEWKKDYKTWGLACEVALGMGKRWADKLIKRYNETDDAKVGTIVPILSSQSDELETRNSLPDPLADIDAKMPQSPQPPKTKDNGHMTGKALKDSLLENGESVTDYKRTHKAPSHSGKPIYAMPAWKELEEFIGKAINRTDAVNHLLPRPDLKKTVMGALKLAFSTSEEWHKLAKAL